MGLKDIARAAAGIPPSVSDIKETGGRALLDPIGSADPKLQQYTDVLNVIHKPGGIDYSTGLDMAQTKAKQLKDAKQAEYDKVPKFGYPGYKKGGKVKAKAYKSGGSAKVRGCGIAQKGLTKGRMV